MQCRQFERGCSFYRACIADGKMVPFRVGSFLIILGMLEYDFLITSVNLLERFWT